jgi:small subunit ribosomal protein S7
MMLMQEGKETIEKKEDAKIEAKEEAKPAAEPAEAAEAESAEKPEAAKKPSARRVAKKAPATVELGEQLLFEKYSLKDVVINDPSLANYITLNAKVYPSTFGRRKDKVYFVTHVNIVERLINKMMRGGTGQRIGGKVIRTKGALQGKKIKVMRSVEAAFDIINRKTGKNPVQLFVGALENAAPIEDTTRVRYGGISYNVAVGISAARRLDVALRNLALASLIGAFKSRKSLADALADEIILASNRDTNSYAIKKKVELERIARSAR